jgi:hypothetical protein
MENCFKELVDIWDERINSFYVQNNHPHQDLNAELERVEGGFGITPQQHFNGWARCRCSTWCQMARFSASLLLDQRRNSSKVRQQPTQMERSSVRRQTPTQGDGTRWPGLGWAVAKDKKGVRLEAGMG